MTAPHSTLSDRDPPPEPAASGDAGPPIDAPPHPERAAAMSLRLVDFLDPAVLQDIQDGFTAVTRLRTTILDPGGQPVTASSEPARLAESDKVFDQLVEAERDPQGRFTAPIMLEGRVLGMIALDAAEVGAAAPPAARQALADRLGAMGLDPGLVERVADAAEAELAPTSAGAIQFLYLMADSIARLCHEELQARQRSEELSVLYKVSTVLSAHRDLQQVLDVAARSVAEVMRVKAVSIRLLKGGDGQVLEPRAVFNLSEAYINKGELHLSDSTLFSDAMAGEVVHVLDMATDPRVRFPGDAKREGLASMLCGGIVFQGKPIGTLQLFTEAPRGFSKFECRLVRAIAQLLGTAIQNARLDEQRQENRQMIRQLHLAADVQRRMLPNQSPRVPPFDIAARYVPSFELGGDFYDFIDLDGHIGVAVGDVVGKGIAASLLMASVRASLRAYAQDVYDLDEIITRVNTALSRDTLDNEFATLWYGVLNPQTLRLTYCNAGHEPPLLLRRGVVHRLDTGGMLVGVDAQQPYQKGLWDLEPGDVVLLYTDGLPDAFDAQDHRFGRKRIEEVLRSVGERSAHEAINHILWEMRRFTGLRRASDDTTLVVIRVTGPATDPLRQ